jgi:hypothetical protein
VSTVHIDFGPVIDRVHAVDIKVDGVAGLIADLAVAHAQTKAGVDALSADLAAFRKWTRQAQTIQWAQTRLGVLGQQREHKFGHLARVRQLATGMANAIGSGIVSKALLTELAAATTVGDSRFWLPPALQAFAAWVGDDRPLAEAALKEAIRRSDAKTAMFFALIARRCGRQDATSRWLKRYFQCQHPTALDRDVVVMLNGMAAGVFGAAALSDCLVVCRNWFTELEAEPGFQHQQVQRWKDALDQMGVAPTPTEYPELRKHSPSWSGLDTALTRARRHQALLTTLQQVFDGDLVVSPRLTASVDELLDALVGDHDPDEIPLEREAARLEALIRSGDEDEADREMRTRDAGFGAKQDFATLLGSIAMHPEDVGANEGAQRYAVALSKHWILEANDDLTARDRLETPSAIALEIGAWKGATTDGADEEQLVAALRERYAALARERGRFLQEPATIGVAMAAAGLAYWAGLGSALSWFFLVSGGAFLLQKRLTALRIRRNIAAEGADAERILRAVLAELVDIRREIRVEECRAVDVRTCLGPRSPEEYVRQLDDAGRGAFVLTR